MEKRRNLGNRNTRIPSVGGWSLRRAKAAKREWKAKLRTFSNIVKVRLQIKPVEGKSSEYFIHDTSIYDGNHYW